MLYVDLQNEVKRRATRDQGGTQFNTPVKNVLNFSLFRIARDSLWRPLRRKAIFSTVTSYTTGSGNGSFTNASATVFVTGATFVTDGVVTGRRVKLSGDGGFHTIKEVNGETELTLERSYSGTATTTGTYSVLGQEEYNLPMQVGHRMFMWHEEYGYPVQMVYMTDQEFYSSTWDNVSEAVPTWYRMWNENRVINQPLEPSIITVNSSDNGDTSISIMVAGTVEGFPDSETIATDGANGTALNSGNKTFSNIDRVTKGSTTSGRIQVFSNSTNNNIAVIPVGDITDGALLSKVQLYPLPNTAFNMHVQYYKDPMKLVNDGDVHELGEEFDESIILLSVSKIKAEENQKEGSIWFSMYQDEIRSLRKTNVDKIDWFPGLKRPYGSGAGGTVNHILSYRQIGPFYGRSSSSRR